jgi:hypothetical protein
MIARVGACVIVLGTTLCADDDGASWCVLTRRGCSVTHC